MMLTVREAAAILAFFDTRSTVAGGSPAGALEARQDTNITEPDRAMPAACDPLCAGPFSTGSWVTDNCIFGNDTACNDRICDNTFIGGLERCWQCLGTNNGANATEVQDALATANAFRTECTGLGYNISAPAAATEGAPAAGTSTGGQGMPTGSGPSNGASNGSGAPTASPTSKPSGSGTMSIHAPNVALTLVLTAVLVAASAVVL